MPTFDVTIQGKTYHVEIPDPGASPLQVIVDGEAFAVGILGVEAQARPLPLASAPRPAPMPTALPPVARVAVARPAVVDATTPAGRLGVHDDSGCDIVAPMPGTILTVDAQIGQAIEAGQVVCVLEAMKMKNPIRATHAGTVAEIAVQPGQTVAYSARLVRLE